MRKSRLYVHVKFDSRAGWRSGGKWVISFTEQISWRNDKLSSGQLDSPNELPSRQYRDRDVLFDKKKPAVKKAREIAKKQKYRPSGLVIHQRTSRKREETRYD